MNTIKIIAIAGALSLGLAGIAAAQDQNAAAASSAATQNPALKSPKDMINAPLAKGHNSFTKAEAKHRIHKAGYTNVEVGTMDADGLWQAKATKDGRSVKVALDYKGNVAAQ